jgi:SAM-dependent methyltransferase
MKKTIVKILKQCPPAHNTMIKLYHSLSSLKRYFLGTRVDEQEWANYHLKKNKSGWGPCGNDWIKDYWLSRSHSHRQFLISIISKHNPKSILEVGCNCGPNLYILAKKFPSANIVGVDINPLAVQKGNEWFAQEGISNVKLLVGKADELERFRNRSFDVVFTDAILIYIGPDKIKRVIAGLLRIADKALILNEWHSAKVNSLGAYEGNWVRNYISLLKEITPGRKIKITKIPEELWLDKNWQKWGGVVEVVMR